MNGWAREIIRDNDEVICYLPDKKAVMAGHNLDISTDKNFPSLLPEQTEKLKHVYSISVRKSERIAGRSTQMLTILPKDAFRYGYRLWADDKTGLLLKTDLIGAEGKILEQFMFTAIVIGGEIADVELKPGFSGKGMVWQRAEQTSQDSKESADWVASDLPAGFEITKQMVRGIPGKPHPVTHLVFSDGLATVSVFIEKGMPAAEKDIATGMGGVHAYRTRRDNYQVTTVGEVPAVTVARIGESIHPRK
jgi:sigma-E factor negative regulatory protein RseB